MPQNFNQGRRSVSVWCEILDGKIIGPFVFNEHLNGECYLRFLRDAFSILLEDGSLAVRQYMWIQQDGYPAHFTKEVIYFLNQQYEYRWIGRCSIFPQPPRSPDLTVLDFYLWDRIKDLAFPTSPASREDLIQ